MSAEEYSKHLRAVKKAFHRGGTDVSNVVENDIEALGQLETMLRASSPEGGVLSDLASGAYEADYYAELRKRYFPEYLEYRKMYLEVSLEDYVGERYGLPDPVSSAPDVEEEYEEEYTPESRFEEFQDQGLVLYTLPYGEDAEGFDIWYDEVENQKIQEAKEKFIEADFSSVSLMSVLAPTPAKKSLQGIGFPRTEPLGVDSEGFDVWIEDPLVAALSNSSIPLESDTDSEDEIIDLLGDADEEVADHEDEIPDDWNGTDAEGFDIWHSDVEELSESQSESAVSEVNGDWLGIDTDGFDIWKTPYDDVEKPTEFDSNEPDGYDHSSDPEREALGELHSQWLGEDSEGFDLWKTDEDAVPSIADPTPQDENLNSPHYGVDSDGFDIWVSPVAPKVVSEESVSGTVSSNTRGSDQSMGATNSGAVVEGIARVPVIGQLPVSAEDRVLEAVDSAITGAFQFGKRLFGGKRSNKRSRTR